MGQTFFLSDFFKQYLGVYGSVIITSFLLVVCALLLFGFFFADLFLGIRASFARLAEFYQVRRKIKISEEELLEYYNQNKEEFLNSENQIKPFKKVKGLIKKKVRKKMYNEQKKLYEQELRRKYKTEINYKILASL